MTETHIQTNYRMISPAGYHAPVTPYTPGPAPQLEWLEINRLFVDPSYQREIGKRGALNIKRITDGFEWSKFAPVIVAPVEGGLFAIVDGQHRTTAAALRGIEKVPCQIVYVDRAKQAEAYAAVNGNVTKTTPQQLFHARLAAGEPQALAVADACSVGGVEIVRNTLLQKRVKQGQTQAVVAIARCLETYGRETLITALQCITQTGDGNPGYLRATIIEALCQVLHSVPSWRDAGEALLHAMDNFDFASAWDKAMEGRNFILSPTVQRLVAESIHAHLSQKIGLSTHQAAA